MTKEQTAQTEDLRGELINSVSDTDCIASAYGDVM